MTMPFVSANEGYSAFVAIGLKWPGRSASREEGKQGLSHGGAFAQPVIDVDAHVENANDFSSLAPRYQNLATPGIDPLLRAYAVPNRPGQTPRLLYRTPLPGQLIDVYA